MASSIVAGSIRRKEPQAGFTTKPSKLTTACSVSGMAKSPAQTASVSGTVTPAARRTSFARSLSSAKGR